MQWKTESAGLFITRDRLAANAAFSPRTRSGNTERAYSLSLSRAMDRRRIMRHGVISSCQSAVTFEIVNRGVTTGGIWVYIPPQKISQSKHFVG